MSSFESLTQEQKDDIVKRRLKQRVKLAEYSKKYRTNNKEKVNKYSTEYYKEYRIKNKDKIKEYVPNYHKRNQDKIKEQNKLNSHRYMCELCGFHSHSLGNYQKHNLSKKHNKELAKKDLDMFDESKVSNCEISPNSTNKPVIV